MSRFKKWMDEVTLTPKVEVDADAIADDDEEKKKKKKKEIFRRGFKKKKDNDMDI